ncbi:MAG: Fic family protein [Flavipsychrobacter sp.]|nr:Fic family protein [Flavipsychrobacter sp.]
METSLDAVNRLAEELRSLLPMKAEDQKRLDKKFRLEFNYNSNHLEGNTLTYGETELLLIFDDTKGNHTMREYEEMKAHDVALQMIEEYAHDRERPLTEQFIKNLNKTILVRPYWKDAITSDGQNTRREIKVGDYKEYQNSVRLQNGEIFEYASPVDTPIQMQELIEWYRKEEAQSHPITLAAMLHYKFVRIHPFDDGNGRIARLLLNYVLLKNEFPPVIIKSDDKAAYLRALNRADTGDFEAFIDYVTEQVKWSLEISVKAAKGEDIDDDDDWKKRLQVLKKKTDNKNVVQETQSATTLNRIGNDLILPLIDKFLLEFVNIQELFTGRNLFILVDSKSYDLQNIEDVKPFFSIQNEKQLINTFEFHYYFQGYKRDDTNTFSIWSKIQWRFEPYRFSMTINDATNQSLHLYQDVFTESEINGIIRKCGEHLINQIELFLT